MRKESEFPKALKVRVKEVELPNYLTADSVQAQKSKEVVACFYKIGTTLQILEKSTQWADRAEIDIGLSEGMSPKGHS